MENQNKVMASISRGFDLICTIPVTHGNVEVMAEAKRCLKTAYELLKEEGEKQGGGQDNR